MTACGSPSRQNDAAGRMSRGPVDLGAIAVFSFFAHSIIPSRRANRDAGVRVVTNRNAICGHASRHSDIGATLILNEVTPESACRPRYANAAEPALGDSQLSWR